MRKSFLSIITIAIFTLSLVAQDHGQDMQQEADSGHGHSTEVQQEGDIHQHVAHGEEQAHATECGDAHHGHEGFNPGATAFHHISDQNIYNIGPFSFPLPCMLYAPEQGWEVFMSSVFQADGHGNGTVAYNRYLLFEGSVRRVRSDDFPMGEVEIGEHALFVKTEENADIGKNVDVVYVCYEGEKYACDNKSTADGGLFGGGVTSFYDFSITKNVATMLIVFLLLGWMFFSIAKAYQVRDGKAPKGLQSFIEPVFLFIQEEVVKPFLGPKWEKYQSFIMALFFFILGLNLFGQVPFLGGSNVTGNLSVTLVLAVFAFLVTTFSGNKHYWQHVFWMPGIPAWVKTIVTPVEFLGLFIKPLTLMLRLFGNITAGHMVIVIFVGLIFIFGNSGENPAAAWGTSIGSILLTLFMMAIELLVAFIQAFVFAILTASYIGAATEEHHH